MMVDNQIRPADVTKFPIIEAMLAIPREEFMPAGMRESAYVGKNVRFAPGRVILDPATLARMLDAVDIQPDDLVLDVGCGHGYSAAVAAWMADTVVAVEEDEAAAAHAQETLSAQQFDNAAVMTGPLAEGAAQHGPYDVILVEGGVETMPPALVDQLKEDGRIAAVFVDGHLGTVRVGHKHGDHVTWRRAFDAGAPVLPGFARERGFVF